MHVKYITSVYWILLRIYLIKDSGTIMYAYAEQCSKWEFEDDFGHCRKCKICKPPGMAPPAHNRQDTCYRSHPTVLPAWGLVWCRSGNEYPKCPHVLGGNHGRFDCTDSFSVESVCTLTCDAGYSVYGRKRDVYCLDNGTWSTMIPSCIEDTLPPLPHTTVLPLPTPQGTTSQASAPVDTSTILLILLGVCMLVALVVYIVKKRTGILMKAKGLCADKDNPNLSPAPYIITAEMSPPTQRLTSAGTPVTSHDGHDVIVLDDLHHLDNVHNPTLDATKNQKWHLDGPKLVDLVIQPGCAVSNNDTLKLVALARPGHELELVVWEHKKSQLHHPYDSLEIESVSDCHMGWYRMAAWTAADPGQCDIYRFKITQDDGSGMDSTMQQEPGNATEVSLTDHCVQKDDTQILQQKDWQPIDYMLNTFINHAMEGITEYISRGIESSDRSHRMDYISRGIEHHDSTIDRPNVPNMLAYGGQEYISRGAHPRAEAAPKQHYTDRGIKHQNSTIDWPSVLTVPACDDQEYISRGAQPHPHEHSEHYISTKCSKNILTFDAPSFQSHSQPSSGHDDQYSEMDSTHNHNRQCDGVQHSETSEYISRGSQPHSAHTMQPHSAHTMQPHSAHTMQQPVQGAPQTTHTHRETHDNRTSPQCTMLLQDLVNDPEAMKYMSIIMDPSKTPDMFTHRHADVRPLKTKHIRHCYRGHGTVTMRLLRLACRKKTDLCIGSLVEFMEQTGNYHVLCVLKAYHNTCPCCNILYNRHNIVARKSNDSDPGIAGHSGYKYHTQQLLSCCQLLCDVTDFLSRDQLQQVAARLETSSKMYLLCHQMAGMCADHVDYLNHHHHADMFEAFLDEVRHTELRVSSLLLWLLDNGFRDCAHIVFRQHNEGPCQICSRIMRNS